MPGKIKNIEEIKLQLPDYIMGRMNAHDSKIVEDALKESDELKVLLEEMGGTLNFLSTVKQKEPEPQYWATILPRIHEKLDEDAEKRFSWDKLAVYWKVFVPVTAVILIAIFYFVFLNKNNESTLTKKENKEQVIDTIKNIEKKDNIKKDVVKEDKVLDSEKSADTEHKYRKQIIKDYKEQYTDIKEDEIKKTDDIKKEDITNGDNTAIVTLEQESVLVGGAGGIDDEMDRELNMLSDKEQMQLIEELSKSNL